MEQPLLRFNNNSLDNFNYPDQRKMSINIPNRSEIDDKYKWDLSKIYESEKDFNSECKAVRKEIKRISAYEGCVFEDGKTLLTLLETYETLRRRLDKIGAYARMQGGINIYDQTANRRYAQVRSLEAEASDATSFIISRLQLLDDKIIRDLIDSEPELDLYERYINDKLRIKEFTLPKRIEDLLSKLSPVLNTSAEIYSVFSEKDLAFPTVMTSDGKEIQMTKSNYVNLMKRPNRDFRREVYESYYDTWSEVENTIALAYDKSIKSDIVIARERGHETARCASLFEANIPTEVHDVLLETVRCNIEPLHQHIELKRDALDVDELQMWDLYVPLVSGEMPEIEYETACKYVVEAAGALGRDYQQQVANGLDSGWVDVFEHDCKRSGAYSGGTYDTPPFILMNYHNDLSSLYTLAHELGHSMHSQFTKEHQPYIYSDIDPFIGEVAAIVNEVLLTRYLLQNLGDESVREHVLNKYVERIRSLLYRRTMFAGFEHRAYQTVQEGNILTADHLSTIFREWKDKFYKPAVVDKRISREWMRLSMLFDGYSGYQYATAISAAVALVRQILRNGEDTITQYINLLKSGSRKRPTETLSMVEINLRSGSPTEATISEYMEHLNELEACTKLG